jgi:hypothetical protein
MLPKFLAFWLVVLIIVPFTAPFSTFDLARAQGSHAPLAPPTHVVKNDDAFPNVPCISTAGRVRLVRLLVLPLEHADPLTSSARLVSRCVSAGHTAEQFSLATILRL